MISVQEKDFSLAEEYDQLRKQHSSGAIVTFCGLVRDLDNKHSVQAIELEHYPGMTEKSLAAIVGQAHARWSVHSIRVIHRIGKLFANDQIVFVGVCGAHRKEAFAACEFVMDYLKTQAPFWKKQFSDDKAYWVEAKDSDTTALDRWSKP